MTTTTMRRPVIGSCYLLHFDQPYKHAAHYIGWSRNLPVRLIEHESGKGARLTSVVLDAGIRWVLTRTWAGVTREYERTLKDRHGPRVCPLCGIKPRPWPESPEWGGPSRNGVVLELSAECRVCRTRKPLFGFDLTGRTRRVCLECIDGGYRR